MYGYFWHLMTPGLYRQVPKGHIDIYVSQCIEKKVLRLSVLPRGHQVQKVPIHIYMYLYISIFICEF